ESMKTISVEKDDIVPADQGKIDDNDVVDVDDLESEERTVEKTPAPTIAKRLRSQSGKVVAFIASPAKSTKSIRKTVSVGPKKQWSKVVPPSETKKKGV
ncbi:hypothetical protein A2U01_0073178, partial [Trifolium medium]|nr:hypothetical protein [Trifolium medium]